MSSAGGHSVGFFELPALPEDKPLSGMAGGVREWVWYLLMAIVAIHVLAAVNHHVADKGATLRRMIEPNV